MYLRHFFCFLTTVLFLTSAAFAQQDSFQIGGLMRSYIVYAPSGISNPALVFNMHGMGSNAVQERAYTQFDKIADREKFIVVYPNGVSNAWDITANRDVTFILALIDTINTRYKIDRSRVYATGMSMGGYMSHRLGCAAAGSIAAIAPVAGLCVTYNCMPSRPMPVLQIHGTADSTVKYSGVAATISFWVSKDVCPQTVQKTSPYPASNPNSKVSKDYYGPCSQNSEVILLTVEGGGHAWPGGFGASQDINASEEIWAFFKNHALPSAVLYGIEPGSNCRSGLSIGYYAGKIRVSGTQGLRSMSIIDARGRLAATLEEDAFVLHDNCREAAFDIRGKGVYLVIVKTNAGTKATRMVVQ